MPPESRPTTPSAATAGAHAPSAPPPWSGRDWATTAVLIATALVIGAPILAGGWRTYFDNAPHLAEIYALAGEGADGWSEIGFAGLAIGSLHSPVIWRTLAWLHGAGVAIEPIYALLLCLALAAPAVALFAVARRRVPAPLAAGLALLLLLQRSAIVGTSSALGGMFAFYLASAVLIVLADALARPRTDAKHVATLATAFAAIGLTHLFVLQAAALFTAVHTGWAALTRRRRTGAPTFGALLRRDATAAALGALASAAYWWPVAVSAGVDFQAPSNRGPFELLQLLWQPLDALTQVVPEAPMATALPLQIEVLPQGALLLAGLFGATRLRRYAADPLAASGAGLAVAVAGLLLLVDAADLSWLGPVSWRFVYFIRVGAALAAISGCAWLVQRRRDRQSASSPAILTNAWRRRGVAAVLAVATIASGWLWGAGLRSDVLDSDGSEVQEVQALWRWLRQARTPAWGRVYIQDTYMTPPAHDGLVRSHLLALTLHETGLAPIGPYYGVIPSATAQFTVGEFGLIFGRDSLMRPAPGGRWVLDLPLADFGATHLISVNAQTANELRRVGMAQIGAVGRFAIFAGAVGTPAIVGVAVNDLLALQIGSDHDGTALLAHAYHPFWRIALAPAGTRLVRGSRGRMRLLGLPAGPIDVALAYDPPLVWPWSLLGWLLIAAWAGRARRVRV